MIKPTAEQARVIAATLCVTNQATGNRDPWLLYAHQLTALDTVATNSHSIWLKARQLGLSTLMVYFYFLCGIMNENTIYGIVADKYENATGLLDKIRDWCDQLGLERTTDKEKEIVLANGSTFRAVTVNSSVGDDASVGRSKTYHGLLLSEAAFYNNSHAVTASLLSALTIGAMVIVESTATPADTWFRNTWEQDNNYVKTFISFQDHQNYQLPADSITDEQYVLYSNTYHIYSRPHAAYWHNKLTNQFGNDTKRCMREYPVIADHAWATATGRWIAEDAIVAPYTIENNCKIFHANWSRYVIGVDVSGASGGDYFAICVYDVQNNRIAAQYADSTSGWEVVSDRLDWLIKKYQPVATYVETNNSGDGFINYFWVKHKIQLSRHTTTEKTKYYGLELVRNAINNKQLQSDELFKKQASALTYSLVNNKERFSHPGDTLMAASFCLIYAPSYFIVNANPPRPPVPQGQFDMDRILKREERKQRKQSGKW